MVVERFRSRVLVWVPMLVQMFVRMGVGMLMGVLLAPMPMLVAVGVSMLMSMQMFMFVVAMHGGTPFRTVALTPCSTEWLFWLLKRA
ncbi:MAG: hypothetical protein ACOYXY_18830 [Thermodesulfobacteriota bacterium]